MAEFLQGVLTNKGRDTLAGSFAHVGGEPLSYAVYFKIGEGGYQETPAGNVPKPPDPAKLDIEATGTPGNMWFRKDFLPGDIQKVGEGRRQFRCRLTADEANDDGTGAAPKFYELGIFDNNDVLICYATFDEQTKNSTKVLDNSVQVVF